MKILWRGAGIFLTEKGDVVYPGETVEVDASRGAALIAAGLASDNLRERLRVDRDPDFPPPSKADRARDQKLHRDAREQSQSLVLERRLHPHGEYVYLSPVPIDGGAT